ncbi:MAG: PCRF domain-containing protein, partial [Methylococcales bacterium]|nr:PCRF domain-containing protein [Methylococcales bacterium]
MEMLDKIAHVARRYEDLERQMADPLISVDYSKLNVLVKEHAEIEPLVKTYNAFEAQTQELADSREMREMEDDHEMQSYLDEEIKTLQSSIGNLKNEL